MEFLVGSTGFVGTNLSAQHHFDKAFHSTNIHEAYGRKPSLLVYAGVRSEMFLANKDPEADYRRIEAAIYNIQEIGPEECVLISSIAVYPDSCGADESTEPDETRLNAYGRNRLFLERWVKKNMRNSLIIRLPAIYGINLRKNFIYDYIHRIPPMLTDEKMEEFSLKEPYLPSFYDHQENGYWKCRFLYKQEENELRSIFLRLNFDSLSFTDSRSVYQFYALKNLWKHIEIARNNELEYINLVTPPVTTEEVYHMLCGGQFHNYLEKMPFYYDLRTKYDRLFGHDDGYIMTKEEEMKDIEQFVREMEPDK